MTTAKETVMPFPLPRLRLAPLAFLVAASLPLAACGGGEKGNTTQAHLSDLEKADGTISDAMTDLDGVQTETPVAALSNGAAPAASPTGNASEADNTAAPADEEVVADQ
ncbi:hypothetical protein OOT33_03980 [Sphingobium sp. DEHP117]|uniref:hypothetical protein n=1 Tax=Sphingobium sp. DEHP117 TaxID=2993436 RepID=UPI0027D66B0A|nr:hypothetical protein [Sphingobium sp. DEHP117]MDQ4419599.1 hypothetical protein [Sphingobium sp. DEHP117]